MQQGDDDDKKLKQQEKEARSKVRRTHRNDKDRNDDPNKLSLAPPSRTEKKTANSSSIKPRTKMKVVRSSSSQDAAAETTNTSTTGVRLRTPSVQQDGQDDSSSEEDDGPGALRVTRSRVERSAPLRQTARQEPPKDNDYEEEEATVTNPDSWNGYSTTDHPSVTTATVTATSVPSEAIAAVPVPQEDELEAQLDELNQYRKQVTVEGQVVPEKPWYQQRWVWIVVGILVLAAVIGGIVGGVVAGNSGGSSSNNSPTIVGAPVTAAPTMLPPTNAPTSSAAPTTTASNVVGRLAPLVGTPTASLLDTSTPQGLAVQWLVTSNTLLLDDRQLVERYALAVLYYAQAAPTHWPAALRVAFLNPTTSVCEWQTSIAVQPDTGIDYLGVSCDNENNVQGLAIGFGQGPVPSELGLLTNLELLTIDSASGGPPLTGMLPSELGNLGQLQLVKFASGMEGPIPSTFGRLDQLTHLELTDHDFSGSRIPTEIYGLNQLQILKLGGNLLGGSLPSYIGQMEALQVLELQDNNLFGPLPSEMGQLLNMTTLFVQNNRFDLIPIQMRNLASSVLDRVNLLNNEFGTQHLTNIFCVSGRTTYTELLYDCENINAGRCSCCTRPPGCSAFT